MASCQKGLADSSSPMAAFPLWPASQPTSHTLSMHLWSADCEPGAAVHEDLAANSCAAAHLRGGCDMALS